MNSSAKMFLTIGTIPWHGIRQHGPGWRFTAVYQNAAITGFPSSNYSTHTILLHILDYGTIRFEMGYASAIAVVLFAIMLISWVLIKKALRKLT